MKILYVEDNPANVYLVQRVARAGAHEVINLDDGERALNEFNSIKPDLVLMDIQLVGNLNGLDVVRHLRDQGHQVPIIAVTAYAMVGDRERCLTAGCNDYMAKPLPVPRLIELFNRYSKRTTQETATVNGTAQKSGSDSDTTDTTETTVVTEKAKETEATAASTDTPETTNVAPEVTASDAAAPETQTVQTEPTHQHEVNAKAEPTHTSEAKEVSEDVTEETASAPVINPDSAIAASEDPATEAESK